MKRAVAILVGLVGAALAVPSAGWAADDGYAAGFFTRGVDAASYIDQGGAVIDPFYMPVRTTGALLPRVSLSISHEDNVFLSPSNGAPNTSIALAPGLLAILGRPTGNHLYADYGMIVPVYESEEDVSDRPSHLLRLGSVYRTGKSQIQGQVGYRLLEDVDTVVGARVAKRDVLGDLGVEHRISGKSSAGLQGRVEMHEFDAENYLDYNRYYGAGRLYHRVSPKSQAFVQGGLGRDDPREDGPRAATDFYDLSLGVRGKQSPKFNAAGRVGYMWRTYDDESRDDFAHWISSLKAESSPFGLSTFSGELYADIRPAIDSDATDVVDQGVTLGAARRLFSERLRGNASATFGQIDYSGVGGPEDGGQDGRSDRYWGFSLGVDWWSKKQFSVGLAYSYMRRDGNVEGDPEAQDSTSYEQGRWNLRASWNY